MRNSEIVSLIQSAGLSPKATDAVVRAFILMNDNKDCNGCLTISISLCIALEYLGYSPKLCIGKFWVGRHDFYHAWIELDKKVIDIAIYGNSSFSPYWIDDVIMPQINKAYNETDVKYEPFTFDGEFQNAAISQAIGWSFYFYCENAPWPNAVWDIIMYYLGSSSIAVLKSIKDIAKKHLIGEQDDT